MIGKIVKGTSFSGCVNYVLKEDKSRLLKAVGVYGSPEEIAEQFELQTLLNDKVKNKVYSWQSTRHLFVSPTCCTAPGPCKPTLWPRNHRAGIS